ncbi:MAG: DASS family sodium-coupled anion symporter [Lewinellaceae bacterium]|nr:DASS family sodium-coupled anion symporter [Phaeodactylibacter sp.]MCB9036720.1 DASS family sodium-coupled anion symporter [Lewinellaceae bacterium]
MPQIKQLSVRHFGLILGPALFVLALLFFRPEGLSPQGRAVLASTLWVAVWWITEAIPIPVTALLPIVLFPLAGGLSLSSTTEAFGHRMIFLYLGGFIIAIAIEKWNLHKRIALSIIYRIGSNMSYIILGFMIASAFLSMWISNTATAVMMLPIGMAIISQLKEDPATSQETTDYFSKALMLSIAYSASIGGIATLIGTPPNLVLAAVVQELYGVEITFSQWIAFGLPISTVLLAICWWYLVRVAYPMKEVAYPGGKAEIRSQLKALGAVSYEEKMVLAVFLLTALAWISRSFLLQKFMPALDDTIIAVAGAIALFLIPSRALKGQQLIDWESAVALPWGIILLFGGGLALAAGFQESGLAAWIGGQMTSLQGMALILILLILVATVNFLTEITSNLATTSMILPILAPMALTIGVHPYALMVGATVAASCAFMLPVATPPNAVVFGPGYLRIPDMVRAGIWMNFISIVLVSLAAYFLLPVLWGVDLGQFPDAFRK